MARAQVQMALTCLILCMAAAEVQGRATKRSVTDTSVMGYLTERTCWWNEICKEEFQTLFRCKCPVWSFCRSPGRYYNAFCTMTGTGYIWTQPDRSWGRRPGEALEAADEPRAGVRSGKNKRIKTARSNKSPGSRLREARAAQERAARA